MPEIRYWHSWRHHGWKREFDRLPAAEQFAIKSSLRDLISSLGECADPMLDGVLRQWRPTEWHVASQQAAFGVWVEYRLGDAANKARAVVCYRKVEDAIYLAARTVIHDHGTMRSLISELKRP